MPIAVIRQLWSFTKNTLIGLLSIPVHLRYKAQVIYQSVRVDIANATAGQGFRVVVIGHLREEKDPFCIVRRLPLLPPNPKITVQHLGMAMNEQMEHAAKLYKESLERYQWVGWVGHLEALKMLANSHLMVISSRMEEGRSRGIRGNRARDSGHSLRNTR